MTGQTAIISIDAHRLAIALHDAETVCLYRDENDEKPMWDRCPNREYELREAHKIKRAWEVRDDRT
jgi:hypothetical protein